MKKVVFSLLTLSVVSATGVSAQTTSKGPSSSQTPYVLPTLPGGKSVSVLTAGDVVGAYPMSGLPDGLGAFDNGNGTFTLVANHEFGATAGAVHAHGSTGAFVSKWIINKSTLAVISGGDLMQNVNLWNSATSSYLTFNAATPSTTARFDRFCSADLPAVSAFYNAATGMGTQERIFMNGEESGNEGRAMAHIITGPNGGTSWELPRLGKFSHENSVANPATGNKTVVAGMDDATPGQVYFYIGDKTNTGNEIEKAGLTNGTLYSIAVSGMLTETNAAPPASGASFTMISLGNVQNSTGATLDANSNTLGITRFLRPEDGAWNPAHPEDFYFVTTNGFGSPSRLWKTHFNNINDLTQGGTITAVLDGTEGQQMLDNIGFDQWGNLIMQEDVGNNAHNGKMWLYNTNTDALTQVSQHDPSRFISGGANFLTQDEEASGIVDMQGILGAGWFISSDQAHYGIPSPIVEGGQFFAFFSQEVYNAACASFAASIAVTPSTPVPGQMPNTIYLGYGPQSVDLTASAPGTFPPVSYTWMPVSAASSSITVNPTATTTYTVATSNGIGCLDTATQTINVKDVRDGSKKIFLCHNGNTLSISVNAVPAHLAHGDMLGDCLVEAKLSNTASDAFTIYPNPADHAATIELNLAENEHVMINVYDNAGKKVMQTIENNYQSGKSNVSFSTANLTSGVYFVNIAVGNETTKLKMVVAH